MARTEAVVATHARLLWVFLDLLDEGDALGDTSTDIMSLLNANVNFKMPQ